MNNKTIVASATFPAISAMSVIRISGPDTLAVLKKIFTFKYKQNSFETIKSRYAYLGFIKDNEKIIDEVICIYYNSPYSYTGEDMAEISCHGNPFITCKILNLLTTHGCSIAEPGEFTKRAFLNGKIDLSQAEAVLDLINAQNEFALSMSLKQLLGNEKNIIDTLKQNIIDTLSLIETELDFSDTVDKIDRNQIKNLLNKIHFDIQKLIKNADEGIILKEGIKIVLTGKPNTGKSSLLNTILRKEKAIVTHIPGTTRDIIEDIINIDGLPFKIYDTAGIRKSRNIVEKKGIKKTKNIVKLADIIVFLIDGSKKLTKEDFKLFSEIKNKNFIIAVNKSDLKQKISIDKVSETFKVKKEKIISISALKNKGIDRLKILIKNSFVERLDFKPTDEIVISNIRHKNALLNAEKEIKNALKNLNKLEIASYHIRKAINFIDTITGKISDENILDNIFKNFCIGK